MSSRTSKASFPPDFLLLVRKAQPSPRGARQRFDGKPCAALGTLAVAVTLGASARSIFSCSEGYLGHCKLIWVCRAVEKQLVLQALSVLFHTWVSLPGDLLYFHAADGTVGAGALMPLVDRFSSILLGHVCILRTAAGVPRAALLRLGGNMCPNKLCCLCQTLLWPARAEDPQHIYHWGENSWVIWCKLGFRSSFNPSSACDYALNFPRKRSLSCSAVGKVLRAGALELARRGAWQLCCSFSAVPR